MVCHFDTPLGLLGCFPPLALVLLGVNLLLLLFSGPIVKRFSHTDDGHGKLRVFRAINLLIILLLLFYHLYLPIADRSVVSKIVGALLVIYFAYLGFHIAAYFIMGRFGKVRKVDDEVLTTETIRTRTLKLITGVLIAVFTLISIIQIFQFESLLQAGGVIGFIGVLLALTQGAWAPDLISGLIILNSRVAEEGDIVQLDAGSRSITGVIFRTKVFHTEILDLINNHRLMIRNTKLRDHVIHNLSRFASARGLRERMLFKIGYDTDPDAVRAMFEQAFTRACADEETTVSEAHPLEVRVQDTGDFAVEWAIYYYIKDVKRLIKTRQLFRELILRQAMQDGIDLSTPMQHVVGEPPMKFTPDDDPAELH